jgi:hypothetical protein
MTEEVLVNRTYEEMRKRGLAVDPSAIPRLRAGVRAALERLSVKVAASPDRQVRNLLRRQFATTVTISSGVGSLAALLSDPRPLMLEKIREADIRDSGGVRLQMLADRASLPSDAPSGFAFGAVEGTSLYTENAASGAATITASFVETDVTLLPAQLEAMAIEELIGTPAEAAA